MGSRKRKRSSHGGLTGQVVAKRPGMGWSLYVAWFDSMTHAEKRNTDEVFTDLDPTGVFLFFISHTPLFVQEEG